MLTLDATTKTFEIDLDGAVAANQLPVTVSYTDITATTCAGGASDTTTNSTTAVTIVAAPGASTQRHVETLTVYNADTASAIVTISLNNAGGTLRTILKVTLGTLYNLTYERGQGWSVLDASGNLQTLPGLHGALHKDGGADELLNDPGAIGGDTPAAGAFTTLSASGLVTVSASGIAFNSDTLDDYEEGTWTPAGVLTTPGDSSNASQVGKYTKIGNLVVCHGSVAFTKGTGTGAFTISGLPFAVITLGGYYVGITQAHSGVGSANEIPLGRPGTGSSSIAFIMLPQSTGGATNMDNTDLGTTATFRFSFVYHIS